MASTDPPSERKETLTTFIPAPPPEATNGHASTLDPATIAIHADDSLRRVSDIAPPIHVTTTFHYDHDPDKLVARRDVDDEDRDPNVHIYSRYTTPNTTRLETLLTPLLGADTVVFSSGLSALHALYILLAPKRVAISGGYHGAHAVLALHARLTGLQVLPLDSPPSDLQAGDVLHVETPLNPTGEARNLAHYAAIAASRGAWLVVDATFAPPPLQDPFALDAHVVMHSGTKYLGGHSDMLYGLLATRNAAWNAQLRQDRTVLGTVMGGLEAWLAVRSVRTLELRVRRQSENTGRLVAWLDAESRSDGSSAATVVERVWHASLQNSDLEEGWLKAQMPHGFGAVFALTFRTETQARAFPSKLRLFAHATSLGGVESLVEWRAMSDATVDPRLVRVSVGIENWEDLRADMEGGFAALAGMAAAGGEGDDVDGEGKEEDGIDVAGEERSRKRARKG